MRIAKHLQDRTQTIWTISYTIIIEPILGKSRVQNLFSKLLKE